MGRRRTGTPGAGGTTTLATDDDLRAAARVLARRVWTVRRADRVAQRLGRARWSLLDRDATGAGGRPDAARDPLGDREGAHVARQSAELARLLSAFAARQRAVEATTPAVRLVRVDEPWRLGEELADPGAARARRELLPCPVVAYRTGPGAWVVFAVPREADLPAWRVGDRDLLVDLGPAVSAAHLGPARPVHRDG